MQTLWIHVASWGGGVKPRNTYEFVLLESQVSVIKYNMEVGPHGRFGDGLSGLARRGIKIMRNENIKKYLTTLQFFFKLTKQTATAVLSQKYSCHLFCSRKKELIVLRTTKTKQQKGNCFCITVTKGDEAFMLLACTKTAFIALHVQEDNKKVLNSSRKWVVYSMCRGVHYWKMIMISRVGPCSSWQSLQFTTGTRSQQ